MTQLTKEYFDEQLKKLATKQDIDELARITNAGFAGVDRQFTGIQDTRRPRARGETRRDNGEATGSPPRQALARDPHHRGHPAYGGTALCFLFAVEEIGASGVFGSVAEKNLLQDAL